MKKLVLLAALLSGTAAVAQADEALYGGVGIGSATQKIDIDLPQSGRKVGAKVYLGYQFNENFAVEGAYTYLNKTTFSLSTAEAGNSVSFNYKTTGHLFSVAATGFLPINDQFSLIGKAGIGIYHSRGTASANENGPDFMYTATGSGNKTTATPVIGVGAEFTVNKGMAIRGEYEYFGKPKAAGDAELKRMDMFTLSLRSTF